MKLDLGEPLVGDEGNVTVPIVLAGCKFKQPTQVVSTRKELEAYMETLAKIIDSERVWADPDMADFDIGERDYLSKAPAEARQSSDDSDQTQRL